MSTAITPLEALQLAVDIAGGQSALARLIGVPNQSTIWTWLNRDKKCGKGVAVKIYRATAGKVTPDQLDPDNFPVADYSSLLDPDYRPALDQAPEAKAA